MDRRKIEEYTASLAVILLFFMTIGVILFSADQIFRWDIFPDILSQIIMLIFVSVFVIIIACVLINVMLNLSIIAINSEKLLEGKNKHSEHREK